MKWVAQRRYDGPSTAGSTPRFEPGYRRTRSSDNCKPRIHDLFHLKPHFAEIPADTDACFNLDQVSQASAAAIASTSSSPVRSRPPATTDTAPSRGLADRWVLIILLSFRST
jgi:hypothetical protein